MKRTVLVIVFAISLIGLAQVSSSNEGLSKSEKQEILNTAKALRNAILNQDVDGVLKHISKKGLGCTDSQFSHARVKRNLYDKNSYLYMSLFDSRRFSAKCKSWYPPEYPAISEREFFLGDRDGPMEVVPLHFWSGVVRVIFKSRVKGHYQREYDFQKEGNEWKVVYGLVVGGCGCG